MFRTYECSRWKTCCHTRCEVFTEKTSKVGKGILVSGGAGTKQAEAVVVVVVRLA